MYGKRYNDAADVAIHIQVGELDKAQELFHNYCKPLCTWECLWLQDRVRFYCGEYWPITKPGV